MDRSGPDALGEPGHDPREAFRVAWRANLVDPHDERVLLELLVVGLSEPRRLRLVDPEGPSHAGPLPLLAFTHGIQDGIPSGSRHVTRRLPSPVRPRRSRRRTSAGRAGRPRRGGRAPRGAGWEPRARRA